nr:anhydro-N-acetylmuramic acid kinase [Synechococcus sp. 1G10]
MVLGLMSGTSADGVDAVLASFQPPLAHPRWRVLHQCFYPYPSDLRAQLIAVGQGQPFAASALLDLAEAVSEAQAECARRCDPDGRAALVGCHGQTIWHRAPQGGRRGASWQLLQGPLLAQLLERPVVFDLRASDLAMGGHGAPLVPAADAALLPPIGGWRAVLNLGGIANLTLLPPAQGPERHQPVRGWDCGPANSLIDLAVSRFSQDKLSYDKGGSWASRGTVQEELIQSWLREPFFQLAPPKSTGREDFGVLDLDRRLLELELRAEAAGAPLEPADALATLTAFSAAVVAADLRHGPRPLELVVAGGGARNGMLMDQLRRRCRGLWVRPLAELGLDEAAREALGFALFAWWHQHRHAGALPSVTGASRAVVMGVRADPSL